MNMPKASTSASSISAQAPGAQQHGRDHADIRQRLKDLPATINLGQPISHRIDHMLSGVRAQIAIKIFGEDLDTLRAQADLLRERLAAMPGLADLEIEKQVLAPQIKVRVDFDAAARYGMPTAATDCGRCKPWSRARR
jgi:HME family heavy-metal exporter